MPIKDENKSIICNKHFATPSKSPFTSKEISLKTQQKLTRKCRIPLSGCSIFIKKTEKRFKEIVARIIAAGGIIVDNPSQATIVISTGNYKAIDQQYTMSLNTFIKTYYRVLYTECERFKADEEHSPRTFRRIKPNGVTHNKRTTECVKAKTAPFITVQAAAAEAGVKLNRKTTTKKLAPSKRENRISKVLKMCKNDVEPVMLEKFASLSDEDLDKIIAIGEVKSKHCLHASSALRIYKQALLQGTQAKDPLNPNYVFNKNDIDRIFKLLKIAPITDDITKYNVRLIPELFQNIELYRISITATSDKNGEFELWCFGYIPTDFSNKKDFVTLVKLLVSSLVSNKGSVKDNILSFRKSPKFWQELNKLDVRPTLDKYIQELKNHL
jgi:hypothetical protein